MLEVSAKEAFEMISSGKAYGVDVREQFEWDAGHAEGVSFNPLSAFNMDAIPTDKPVIVICRSGNRSGQVCEALGEIRSNLHNMVGGMKAWMSEGLPMVALSGEPTVA
jgi:rhodanese-related sulfurtransferase